MPLIITTGLFLLFSCCLWEVATHSAMSVIKVPNGGKLGEWGPAEFCPTGYVDGFSLKFPENRLLNETVVIGIRGHCSDGSFITSSVGEGGAWSKEAICQAGYLEAFSLRVSKRQGILGEDAAVDNIKFRCRDRTVMEGNGPARSHYGEWSPTCGKYEMCGIRTRVEKPKGQYVFDWNELTDVKFFCCL